MKLSQVDASIQALHAVKAARLHKQCGPDAARRYARNMGVPSGLYRLARQLENAR